ncbi:hypothetical protein [Sphingomonas sp.]|uniref:hypothetical protein n=1 Tax=Sphingomonas sp. TaxID=28214 RepID=UPI0025F162C5|nr:hypothetical protein [Sphingomonas sp.]
MVDGLGRAHQRGRQPRLNGLMFRGGAAGPVVEFAHLDAVGDLPGLRAESWFDEASLGPLLAAIVTGRQQWLAQDGRQGLIIGDGFAHETVLNSFKIDAHKAALGAGFGGSAALLIAALGELAGNVVDHSEATGSGVALFSANPGVFELVVADRGIGARRSLTQNPEHAGLHDEGSALEAMVETGVSRFARGTGHGNGFRPIFEKLADMTGHLRFRSGDYALTLDGRFGDRVARQLGQKPLLHGFLAAVTCQCAWNTASAERAVRSTTHRP